MKRIFSLCLAMLCVMTLVSCGAEKKPPEKEITFEADLTLDVLAEILREKGDSVRFSDIPEKYFYDISQTLVPGLRYPIDENTAFFIMQIAEDKFSVMLTVKTEAGSRTLSGAQEILDYINGASAST